ncbi:hypothetical protein EK21DRAFT_61405 [Setomelanomma holmii]|uniref:Uncharacterized protein n=1 Tax=Setomelanomma holmii TaxID=210430 RepID=A0A9P4HEP5_9PLEO|nr:hypothetical protein EK21DRAFT_61405 [Setomelanomma holmii]
MGLATNFVELNQSINFYDNPWDLKTLDGAAETPTADEHPFIEVIQKAVLHYRLQSAAHFEFDIGLDVKRIMPIGSNLENITSLNPSPRVFVKFGNFNGRVPATVRPKLRKHRRSKVLKPTNKIEVIENGQSMPLHNFLAKHFPIFENCMASKQTMQAWWSANGKQFDWNSLPTELKEHVIQSCLHAPLTQDEYRTLLYKHKSFFAKHPGDKPGREFGIYEIVDQLGNWASLLGVSHQVRAIALRLCFIGSSALVHSKGFGLFANSYEKLDNAICRLGRYYQMIEPNSLPTDEKTQVLAHCYKQYPKIYPHLQHYATFAHGIRKVSVYMDFLSYMHFFKVTVGGFKQYWYTQRTTYEVFQQLPCLKEIEIRLPLQPHDGWNEGHSLRGPALFHHGRDQVCPRMLHRVIYEQIAEVLAPYSRVRIKNCGDGQEKARFYALRNEARVRLKFTARDWAELYAECGGGIQLDEPVEQESWDEKDDEPVSVVPQVMDTSGDDEPFFPPKCRCEVRCNLVYQKKERHRRRLWG